MNEKQRALMEGEMSASAGEFFGPRPQFDTPENNRMFEEGFKRAYEYMLPTQCDCMTETNPYGTEKTFCGSAQMMRYIKLGMFPGAGLTTCDMD